MRRFILLSSCPWSSVLQRPHQMARALASLGEEVHFVEPSGSETFGLNTETEGNHILQLSLDTKREIDGVHIYKPVSAFNGNKTYIKSILGLIEHILDDSDETVVISYFPHQIKYLSLVQQKFRLVYDCVDDHSDLTYSYWSSPQDIENEMQMLEKADLILTTSSSLYLSKSFNKDNVYLSKNAVFTKDFQKQFSDQEPFDLQYIPEPRVCYMGAVDNWFDEDLFYQLVKHNPDKSFVVIGPVRPGLLQRRYPNLFVLGIKEHAALSTYLSRMNVGIIPFKDQVDLIVNCDPIKMYEYIASGLPVVSTGLPELCLDVDFVQPCVSYEEFNNALNKFCRYKINQDEADRFIANNEWTQRAQQLIDLLEGRTEPYQKDKVVSGLQQTWLQYLETRDFPILESLLGLSYAETDPDRFFQYTQQAYDKLKIPFTLRNYVLSLCSRLELERAVETICNDYNVDNILRAELRAYATLQDNILVLIKISHCIGKYDEMGKLIGLLDDQDMRTIELAHYNMIVANKEMAFQTYVNYMGHEVAEFSPLFNANLVSLLRDYHDMYTKAEQMCKKLVDYYTDSVQLELNELYHELRLL